MIPIYSCQEGDDNCHIISPSSSMGRASKKDAERHRREIVNAASRLFRERGLDGVSVSELMAAAGMTHGGFYRHFESKEALEALALAAAVDQAVGHIAGLASDSASPAKEVIEDYLSERHRNESADGCPLAALAADVGRTSPHSPVRAALTRGAQAYASQLETLDDRADRQAALTQLCTMVGALILARATQDDPISSEILNAARSSGVLTRGK